MIQVLIILLFIFFVFILTLFFYEKKKNKGLLTRGMDLLLFLVSLPQETEQEKEKQLSLEDYLKNAENFYSSLVGIKEKNFLKRIFLGEPFLVFEIAVHRIGEQIYFYVACPREFSQLVEKQILGFWPKAQAQIVQDYNIFNPEGFSSGAIAFLAKSPVFPLKPYQEFKIDPLSSLSSIFNKLAKEGEGAAIQILIRPSKTKLKKIAEKTIELLQKEGKADYKLKDQLKETGKELREVFLTGSLKKEGEKKTELSQPSLLIQNQISAISQKASQYFFDVNLRILTSAEREERALTILNQLQNAFEQFNSPILNQIKFKKLKGKKLKKLFYNFSFRLFNDKQVLLLSASELASLYHFPSPNILTPNIKWLKAKQAPPPDNLPQEGIIIGKSLFRGEERKIFITQDDRRRHFYVIGQTGTGKSVLLQEMINQDIRNGNGVALIDPHGDLTEKVLSLIPLERIEDVIYFNPADFERPIGLNMLEFDPKYPETKTFVVNELLEIFEKLYNLKTHGFGGPIFEQYMRNSLFLVMEDPESGNTLIEVPRILSDVNFRKYKLSKCQNIVVKNFWELEAEKAGGEASLANMVPYITSKMNIFIANDFMRPIIAQKKSAFNFREIMDEGKILIVNLCKGKLGDINAYLLGMIITGKLLFAALSRADLPEEKRKDFYLYIDEFHNVTTKTISTVLAEARKYRLAMILAHQYIAQLDEDTQKAIFGNVGSMLTFRVGPDDAKYLVTQFGSVFDENDLVNIDNYNGFLRLLIRGETSKPFNIVTFPPSKGDGEVVQLIKKHSGLKYGKDRNQIESEIYERFLRKY